MELKGTIKEIFDTMTFESGFEKREFVIHTDGKYPQDIKFEVVKAMCGWMDKYAEGEEVKVEFDIRGREYNGKYYNTLSCWRLTGEKADTQASTPADTQQPQEEGDNPLPF